MVAQLAAWRVANVVLEMIREEKEDFGADHPHCWPARHWEDSHCHGHGPSTEPDTPFTAIAGSKIFSLEMSITEALTQAFCCSIGIHIEEETDY